MHIEKLVSAIKNDILGGLKGYHQNLALNLDQLGDEVVQLRLAILKEYFLKGVLPIKDFLIAINCVDVDCEALERCRCKSNGCDTLVAHFQIPQLITDFGLDALEYVGSVDRLNRFQVVTSLTEFKNRKYKKFGKNKPIVWIDLAPNASGMLDCFIFNAPLLQRVSVVGAWKDPRQLKRYDCCGEDDEWLTGVDDNMSFVDSLVKQRLVEEKLKYYRQYAPPVTPNDQEYSTGN